MPGKFVWCGKAVTLVLGCKFFKNAKTNCEACEACEALPNQEMKSPLQADFANDSPSFDDFSQMNFNFLANVTISDTFLTF